MSKRLRVLIAEDSEDDALLTILALKGTGFDVESWRVETEQAYLEHLNLSPDLILSDHSMPQFGSERALALLRERALDIPFIVVSGAIGEDTAVALMRAGAKDYILKQNLARLGPAAMRELHDAETRRKQRMAEEALRLSEERFRATFEQAAVGMAIIDLDGNWLQINEKLCDILGYTRAQMMLIKFANIVGFKDCIDEPAIKKCFLSESKKNFTAEQRCLRKDGVHVWCNITVSMVYGSDESPLYLIAVIEDINARKQTEAEMLKLSNAVQQTADNIFITDARGVIEYVNPAFTLVTGFHRDEVLGKTPAILKSGKHNRAFYRTMWQTISSGKIFHDIFINRRKSGELYYEEKTVSPLRENGGKITHFISTSKDITDHLTIQERLQYLAQHDILTDLPNRVFLVKKLDDAIQRSAWTHLNPAVLVVNLDHFKMINDTLGHDRGDQALQIVAERLKEFAHETGIVARLAGDDFAILLESVKSPEEVPDLAHKLLSTLSSTVVLGGREFFITASVGISVYPDDGSDSSTLLRTANIALQRAKESGRNKIQFYSSEMSARVFERLTMEASLRRALERSEFSLHYQPQLDMETGSIRGVEALLRWHHPVRGIVPPDEFIPLLEETGLVIPVGEWVLQSACNQNKQWQNAGLKPIRVAVNLSWRQFRQDNLVHVIKEILDSVSLSPEFLELELTESLLAQDPVKAVNSLLGFKDMGISISIDDFGTGYSSLSYLRNFPIDSVKIDKSFVHDINGGASGNAIAAAIIAMTHSLNLKVIAEGVETIGQVDFLRSHGCDELQGYYISRPLPADQLTQLLIDNRPLL